MMYLSIDQCPNHPEFVAIAVDSDAGGTRITPSKCCGRWTTVKRWAIDERMADEMIAQMQQAKLPDPEDPPS